MTIRATPYLDGVIAGIIGAVIVAIWFLFLDTVSGLPLYAPTVLGGALFLAAEDLASTEAGAGFFETYPDVHMGSWVGLRGAGRDCGIFPFIDWKESQSCFFLLLFVILEFGFVGIAFVFAKPVLHELAWPVVLLGNLLGAAGMACYFRLRHPNLIVRP